MYNLNNIKRNKQKKELKKKLDELLKEVGVSKRKFKEKLPRVHGSGKDFEIDEKRQGKKCSLLQQVIYLSELEYATRELRKEMKRDEELVKEHKEKKKNTTTFAEEK